MLTPEQARARPLLDYTVRFQNTGNYPAFFVRIQDTLSNLLDLATLRVIATSHPHRLKDLGSGVVDFVFEDIVLPDSMHNEPESHGFVRYTIRPKQGLKSGDIIHNTAYIYFDFNEAVVTNTVTTEIKETVSTEEPPGKTRLYLWPNPGKGAFQAQMPEGVKGLDWCDLYDFQGKWVQRCATDGTRVQVILPSHQAPGAYVLRWVDEDGRVYVGKVVWEGW